VKINIEDISYVHFAAPDLQVMADFLRDFGIATSLHEGRLYGTGSGGGPFIHVTELGDPAFVALGLRASSMADLEALASSERICIEPINAPGGGFMISLTDPDGRRVDVVAGQTVREFKGSVNNPSNALNCSPNYERVGRASVVSAAPAHVVRLGHCVLDVGDFRACEAWYKDRFGFITSDEIELQPGMVLGAFMRCDKGEVPTDHHTLFLFQNPQGPGFNHAAFEVSNLNDLMAGHDHLKNRQHKPHWGVGRHILGNQVFDYWNDPWGHTLEHWTDGDLLVASDGSATASLMDLIGVQWGPAMKMPS
jgi:catechol 2,3-dioxygenase-like lactoylglutathione lyase family enzyme